MDPKALVIMCSALAAGFTMISAIGIGIGQGMAAAKAVEAVGRQPEAQTDIIKTMLIGQAVTETTGIFAFIIAIVLLFANPLIGML